eukprot:NODE_442_length_1377_cov_210.312500_g321_i0.p1 GENE.NODE_442_length_1377_cov_210.312500_g321_i0~~NODE_442_length_1377_cov_210.312500_g321_i0.p1  ORF type:complete len:308 (-),score=99.07 NODE_442_length_1377_cov_210.312500_g321_i0:394-1317(-)
MSEDFAKSLKDAQDNVNNRANQMGRLKVEFDHNINKLADSYYPKMRPLRVQVYRSIHEQHFIEKEIQWKEAILSKMYKMPNFQESVHMAREREDELMQLMPKFQDAISSLEALTPADMQVLRKYEHPPELVLLTMEATLILKGEYNTDWEEAKVMLSDAYFFSFFIQRAKNYDKDNIADEVMTKLEQYMLNPDFEPAVVSEASIPCGALCKWVRAIYDYGRTKRIIKVNGLGADDIQGDVDRLKEQLYLKREEVAGAEKKLSGLQNELEERRRDLKLRYDQTMDPLQETFFEAHHQYGTIYHSPRHN